MKNLRLAALSGVLLALSYPVLPGFLLAFIALVPLLFIFEQEQKPKHKFLPVYLTFFIYHAASNWWISSWQPNCDPYLLVSGIVVAFVHPFLFLIPFGFHFFFIRKLGNKTALWIFPFVWVAFEEFHSLGDLAFPWLDLGYTQIYNHYWIQIADLGGVLFASFLVVAVNVLVLKLILEVRESEYISVLIFFRKKASAYKLAAIALIIFLPMIYGFIRVKDFNHEKLISENPSIVIGLIQPDINPWVKWAGQVENQVAIHQMIQDSLERKGHIDLAIWSETAIPFMSLDFNKDHNFSILKGELKRTGTSLLTGFSDYYFYKTTTKPTATAKKFFANSTVYYDAYNSALLLNPDQPGRDEQLIYHKMKLTPFGEQIPFVSIFSFAEKWLEWGVGISSWAKGNNQHNLIYSRGNTKIPIGTIICIESIYPDFVANFVREGAEILCVITNDAWYDHTPGPEQHYLIATMRAIETRRYIARCANSGVSGFITPTGSTLLRAPEYKRLGIEASIPALKEKSVFVRFNNWISVLSVSILILSFFYSIFKKSAGKS